MRVRILRNQKRAPDGIHAIEHKIGEVIDLPDSIAKSWIRQGIAEEDKIIQKIMEVKVQKNATKKNKRTRRRTAKS